MNFIIDAHLDLSMNAMEWNRDLRHEVSYIRKSEAGLKDFPDREKHSFISGYEKRKHRHMRCNINCSLR